MWFVQVRARVEFDEALEAAHMSQRLADTELARLFTVRRDSGMDVNQSQGPTLWEKWA